MTLFDDNPNTPPDQPLPAEPGEPVLAEPSPTALPLVDPPIPLTGDPFSYAAALPVAAEARRKAVPEDLRISWSWPHLLVSIVFFFASQLTVGIVLVAYYSMEEHLSQGQTAKLIESPKFLVASTVIWSGIMILFLYMTLAVLRNLPFWSSLGWKRFGANAVVGKGRPWMYFLTGCGLSIFVAVASSRMKNVDHTPIQELFKSRSGAMLLLAMAVFVAPLFEETLFRGYLYPVLARIISSIAQFVGLEFSTALRIGVASSIFVTGSLFGLMHAPQLGWTWGLVSMLIFVGIIFTFVRAWTGTVLASFLLHLGYNSMIAVTSLIATRGFTHMSPGQ